MSQDLSSEASAAPSNDQMPSGIPYIIGNEAAERFSFYGMKAILMVFMTKYLVDSSGELAVLSQAEATSYYHLFVTATYFFPIIGAVISDIVWGKYNTIIRLSIVYCLGHLCLALFENQMGLAAGLTLIAIGSGGIKPCVSAHVGDQFSSKNGHLVSKIFMWFYFSINLGAMLSTLATPILLRDYGPSVAFGVPGALMFLATIVFWMGRNSFTAVPPSGIATYKKELFTKESLRIFGRLGVVYLFVAIFWALFDQSGSTWVMQAEKLNRTVTLFGSTFEILQSQIQAVNPLMILLFIPLFSRVIYPAIDRVFPLNELRKIGLGLFVTVFSFAIVAYTEMQLEAGHEMSIMWQVYAYAVITAAEVMVSITALEFTYTQAPNSMKSFMMGLFLLSVSLGNIVTAGVNLFIQNDDGTVILSGSEYYWFFAMLMLSFAVVFSIVSRKFTIQKILQDA